MSYFTHPHQSDPNARMSLDHTASAPPMYTHTPYGTPLGQFDFSADTSQPVRVWHVAWPSRWQDLPVAEHAETAARHAPVKRRIPHDFQSKTALIGHKCQQCGKGIGAGKKYHKCSTCDFVCHVACLAAAPEDCGATPVKQVWTNTMHASLTARQVKKGRRDHSRAWRRPVQSSTHMCRFQPGRRGG